MWNSKTWLPLTHTAHSSYSIAVADGKRDVDTRAVGKLGLVAHAVDATDEDGEEAGPKGRSCKSM